MQLLNKTLTQLLTQPDYTLGRVSYSPLFRDMEDLIDSAFVQSRNFSARLDLTEDEGNYYLQLEVPGYKNKEIDITVEDNVLTVLANNEKRGKIERQLSLWNDVKTTEISGKVEDGILVVKLPKEEKVKSKKIEVS